MRLILPLLIASLPASASITFSWPMPNPQPPVVAYLPGAGFFEWQPVESYLEPVTYVAPSFKPHIPPGPPVNPPRHEDCPPESNVPEPATWALIGAALAAFGLKRK